MTARQGFSRPGFATRRAAQPSRSPQQIRADWVSLIDVATRAAQAADQGTEAPAGSGVLVSQLMAALRPVASASFPVEGYSARGMAGVFLAAAQVFANPATNPETRTACAPSLLALARLLDRLFDALRSAEAHVGRRILGEREDD